MESSRPRRSAFKTETKTFQKNVTTPPRDWDIQDRDYIPAVWISCWPCELSKLYPHTYQLCHCAISAFLMSKSCSAAYEILLQKSLTALGGFLVDQKSSGKKRFKTLDDLMERPWRTKEVDRDGEEPAELNSYYHWAYVWFVTGSIASVSVITADVNVNYVCDCRRMRRLTHAAPSWWYTSTVTYTRWFIITRPPSFQWHNLINMRFVCTKLSRPEREIMLCKML